MLGYFNIPIPYRILVVLGLLALVAVLEKLILKERAFRWKGYTLWMVYAICGGLLGFLFDLADASLEVAFYRGAVMGCVCGFALGGVVLIAYRERIKSASGPDWSVLKSSFPILYGAIFGYFLSQVLQRYSNFHVPYGVLIGALAGLLTVLLDSRKKPS